MHFKNTTQCNAIQYNNKYDKMIDANQDKYFKNTVGRLVEGFK